MGQGDLGVRSTPGIYCWFGSPHHLSGKPLNRAIGLFEILHHLFVRPGRRDIDGDARKLRIDRREVAFDRDVGIDGLAVPNS